MIGHLGTLCPYECMELQVLPMSYSDVSDRLTPKYVLRSDFQTYVPLIRFIYVTFKFETYLPILQRGSEKRLPLGLLYLQSVTQENAVDPHSVTGFLNTRNGDRRDMLPVKNMIICHYMG